MSTKKCPNCGATISGLLLSCPQCGYSFPKESDASTISRSNVEKLRELLAEAENSISAKDLALWGDASICQKKVNIITTFQMPVTTENLVEMLLFTYSSYQTAPSSLLNVNRRHVKKAWLGKAKQAYRLLSYQSDIDEQTKKLLDEYSFLKK